MNEAFVRQHIASGPVVGRRVTLLDGRQRAATIVGLVADAHTGSLREAPPAQVFVPYMQFFTTAGMHGYVRSHMPADSVADAIRRVVAAVDPSQPIYTVRRMSAQRDYALSTEQVSAGLASTGGCSTREHNIEQTAYATNIEAAHEIARQLRLRDMAGLVVIDFIDMESNGHIRKVEKAMKEALKNDRARIQVGRISSFGLMEMSRQRLRTGVLEASTRPCPHCDGTGLMRTASSAGLSALRMLEDEAARGRGSRIVLRAGREAAVYLLNKKRAEIAEVEERYGVVIEVLIDDSFEGARMSAEWHGPPPAERPRFVPAPEPDEDEPIAEEDEDEDEDEAEAEADEEEEEEEAAGDDGRPETRQEREERDDSRRRRRRRGRRGGRRRDRPEGEEQPAGEEQAIEEAPAEDAPAPPRRRSRSGPESGRARARPSPKRRPRPRSPSKRRS